MAGPRPPLLASGARADGYEIRRAAVAHGVPCITTMSGASAAQRAIVARRSDKIGVVSLQELHAGGDVSTLTTATPD